MRGGSMSGHSAVVSAKRLENGTAALRNGTRNSADIEISVQAEIFVRTYFQLAACGLNIPAFTSAGMGIESIQRCPDAASTCSGSASAHCPAKLFSGSARTHPSEHRVA